MPGQEERAKSVRRKLNAIDLEFRNKNVLLVDDSIVRGTTSRQIIKLAREAGARRVYFASAAPPSRARIVTSAGPSSCRGRRNARSQCDANSMPSTWSSATRTSCWSMTPSYAARHRDRLSSLPAKPERAESISPRQHRLRGQESLHRQDLHHAGAGGTREVSATQTQCHRSGVSQQERPAGRWH